MVTNIPLALTGQDAGYALKKILIFMMLNIPFPLPSTLTKLTL